MRTISIWCWRVGFQFNINNSIVCVNLWVWLLWTMREMLQHTIECKFHGNKLGRFEFPTNRRWHSTCITAYLEQNAMLYALHRTDLDSLCDARAMTKLHRRCNFEQRNFQPYQSDMWMSNQTANAHDHSFLRASNGYRRSGMLQWNPSSVSRMLRAHRELTHPIWQLLRHAIISSLLPAPQEKWRKNREIAPALSMTVWRKKKRSNLIDMRCNSLFVWHFQCNT